MQGTRVRALVWEDPTCRGATKPVSHNYWACASGACALQRERPRWWEARAPRWRVAPARRNWRKPLHRNEDPTQPKININKLIKKKMELYTITCSFRACLCFSFPWKITHPAFILRTSLSSLKIWSSWPSVLSPYAISAATCLGLPCWALGMGFGQPPLLILSIQNLRFFLLFSLLNLLLMLFCWAI